MTPERDSAPRPAIGENSSPHDLVVYLHDQFSERIRYFALRRLSNRSQAEDIAQETMRIALEALQQGKVQNVNALPAFVFQTARHLCLHDARRERRESNAFAKLGGDDIDTAPPVLDELVHRERVEKLRRLMDALPEEDRALLRFFYVEGLDAARVGDRLSLSAVAARVRKHRLLARIAFLLQTGNDRPGAGTEE